MPHFWRDVYKGWERVFCKVGNFDNLTAESGAHSQCGCRREIAYPNYMENEELHLENNAAIIVARNRVYARLDNALVE